MTNLRETLQALQTTYLIADGLMLRVENECIVRNLVTDINSDFDNLTVKCVELADSAVLPGTVVEKITVKKAKVELHVSLAKMKQSNAKRKRNLKQSNAKPKKEFRLRDEKRLDYKR